MAERGASSKNGQDDRDRLEVWNEGRLVGSLWREANQRMGFRYDANWLAEEMPPLSQTLPLQAEAFDPTPGVAHDFFANLLPEANARSLVLGAFKSGASDFSLLRAHGGECAGAIAVMPVGEGPPRGGKYHPISHEDLRAMVMRHGSPMPWRGSDRPRLSLAGAQNKCPVLYKDGKYWFSANESPSSHILKFELRDYRNVPAYETFTTMLAASVGLPVVNIELCVIDTGGSNGKPRPVHFVRIERYDRHISEDSKGDKITRLHQEDFCQALGYSHENKYEVDDGPSFADCYRLVQNVCSAPGDLTDLLRWQIFNNLAGNSDGHAKNLSLLYLPDGKTRLAPFYDLVCTRAVARVDHKMAFAIGGGWDPSLIQAKHWKAMAKECDVQPRLLLNMVQETADTLLQQLAPVRQAFEAQHGPYPALQRIEQVIQKRCHRRLVS